MKTILNSKYLIILPILILNIISLIYLHNTTYFTKHLIYLIISFFSLLITSKINFNFIKKYIKFIYIISITLLLIVLIFGKEINGSKAWLKLFGFSFQPSELAKLALILYTTITIQNNNKIIKPFILFVIPSILTFLEPDTGAIIIYFIIFISTLKFIKINKKLLLIIFTSVFLIILIHICIYFTNQNILIKLYGPKLFYRIDRLISFQNQNNIQNINSLISIGSGKLLYIPENHNDFIFASIISKYSPLSFILIISCYITIFKYYIRCITHKKNISNTINFIILNMLLFQVFYNILMNLSLVPIIGIPLPFLSYGGSYLITLYTLIGISINLNSNNNKVV